MLLLLPLLFAQCKKLTTLPEYKSPAGTKLDTLGFQCTNIVSDPTYTYLHDNIYHLFFRIQEADGKMENLPQFNTIKAFAADSLYLYIARANVYPAANTSLYRISKTNYNDSLLLDGNATYTTLSYYDGYLYGWSVNAGLAQIDRTNGSYTLVLSKTNFYISQVSFLHYNNSSKFYNGHWLFINEDGKYLVNLTLDGSEHTDTTYAVKSPIFEVYNNKIYFSYPNPNTSIVIGATTYRTCLASTPLGGGPVTIEDSVNINYCSTVRLLGDLLLVGDGRFIKTFNPATKEVKLLGAMDASADIYGQTTATYPFCNSYTGSIYYTGYQAIAPVFKLK
jgi:hypothetical protein